MANILGSKRVTQYEYMQFCATRFSAGGQFRHAAYGLSNLPSAFTKKQGCREHAEVKDRHNGKKP